ncbi:MAG: serine/threonine protein kinase [Bdellovibrio sp.]|nr:MAG: serine/threonine protein kinase [Bdellovibrio sp.]
MAKEQRLRIDSVLGSFQIKRLIGKGGMGEVYEAFEPILQRKVALKIISAEAAKDPEIVKYFRTEGRTLAQLNHPNVVTIYSFGEDQGIEYIAMEYVEGESLKMKIKKKELDLFQSLDVFKQILSGTKALHEKGIIHRDLKPHNVIIQRNGTSKIVDFGIAKVMEETVSSNKKEKVIGSVYYLAPEVLRGKPANFQSDIWSLGVVLYEMLTFERPFIGGSQEEIIKKVKREELKFKTLAKMSVPRGIRRIIQKMCDRNLESRYQTIEEIEMDIRTWEAEFTTLDVGEDPRELSLSHSHKSLEVHDRTASQSRRVSTRTIRQKKRRLFPIFMTVWIGFLFLWGAKIFLEKRQSLHLKQKALISSFKNPVERATVTPTEVKREVSQREQKKPLPEGVAAVENGAKKEKSSSRSVVQKPALPKESSKLMEQSQKPEPKPVSKVVSRSSKLQAPSRFRAPLKLVLKFPKRIPASGKVTPLNLPRLSWKKVRGARSYLLQISSNPSFKKVLINKIVRKNTFLWKTVRPGQYYWRVRSLGKKGQKSRFSLARRIKVLLPPPRLRERYKAIRVVSSENQKGVIKPVEVSWKPPPMSTAFKVLVSETASFQKLLINKTVSRNVASLQLPEGSSSFFVKVAVLNHNGHFISTYSQPSVIEVQKEILLSPPILKVPTNGSELLAQVSEENPVVFSWQAVPLSKKYHFQLAKDKGFHKLVLEKTISKNQLFLTAPLPKGTLYWRVRAKAGQKYSVWTPVFKFSNPNP